MFRKTTTKTQGALVPNCWQKVRTKASTNLDGNSLSMLQTRCKGLRCGKALCPVLEMYPWVRVLLSWDTCNKSLPFLFKSPSVFPWAFEIREASNIPLVHQSLWVTVVDTHCYPQLLPLEVASYHIGLVLFLSVTHGNVMSPTRSASHIHISYRKKKHQEKTPSNS